jgi:hypothetical protein
VQNGELYKNKKLETMNKISRISIMLLILLSFSSCEVVEGIFNLGVGVGIFIVVAIIALIIFIISRFKK